MREDQRRWYHTASRIFAVVCGVASVLLVLGVIFCVQDWMEALADGERYPILRMLAEGAVVCGLPALISGALAVRFRNRSM